MIFDTFFSKKNIVDQVTLKCPRFSYTRLPRKYIIKTRAIEQWLFEVKKSMMQHLTVSTTKDLVFRKEYICS